MPAELRDNQTSLTISDHDEVYTKTLGIEWHSVLDHFRLSLANHLSHDTLSKQALVSDVARTYDVLGWFAPVIIKAKILLQSVWESKVDWDEEVPEPIIEEWSLWRSQLKSLSLKSTFHGATSPRMLKLCQFNCTDLVMPPKVPMQQSYDGQQRRGTCYLSCVQNQSGSHKTSYYSKIGALWCLHTH